MDSLDDFFLTPHFIDRVLDMAVTPEEIRETLLRPQKAYTTKTHPGYLNYTRGRLTVVVDPIPKQWSGKKSVVTALWATRRDWQADMALGEYGGRHRRKDRH